MFNEDSAQNNDFYGVTLDNGIELPYGGSKSITGLKNSMYDPRGNGSAFGLDYRAETKNQAARENISSWGVLGFFDDPRKAAYMAAYFDRHPNEIIRKFEALPPKGRRTAVYKGALAPEWPKDLFDKLPFEPEAIKAKSAEKQAQIQARQGERGTQNRLDKTGKSSPVNDTGAWRDLLHGRGIKGGQIAAVLSAIGANGGDDIKNKTVVSQLVHKTATDAKRVLAQLGLNLDDPATIEKIKTSQALSESISESQQQLDRIRQLIKY